MFKRLARCVREYRAAAVLTLILIVDEAVIETAIPFITARLVNGIKAGDPISSVVRIGLLLVGLAFASAGAVLAGMLLRRRRD